MPFGLHKAPATFQRMVNSVLRDSSLSYIDDIVVFSQSVEQHLLHLGRVFQLLFEISQNTNADGLSRSGVEMSTMSSKIESPPTF